MRQNPLCPSQVGTGGQKNDLKLWDLNRPDEPIFRAKNVIYTFIINNGQLLCVLWFANLFRSLKFEAVVVIKTFLDLSLIPGR